MTDVLISNDIKISGNENQLIKDDTNWKAFASILVDCDLEIQNTEIYRKLKNKSCLGNISTSVWVCVFHY